MLSSDLLVLIVTEISMFIRTERRTDSIKQKSTQYHSGRKQYLN